MRARIIVHGRVQGVYFRQTAQDRAERLGLAGWVRNNPVGSVEVLAEGDKAALEELVVWCRVGPPTAQVDRVEVVWAQATGEFHRFRVRR